MSYGLTYNPYNTNLFLNSQTTAIDPSAAAFITAAGITNSLEINAINSLVTSLKGYGIWSKMKAVYPFVTDNRNLLSYTEDFGNSYWISPFIINVNSGIAPNGTNTASALVEGSKSNTYVVSNFSSINLTNAKYNLTVYAKKSSRDWAQLFMNNGTSTIYCWFNLNTGTLGTIQSGATASIADVGNGWYRCSMSITMSNTGNTYGFGSSISDGVSNYTGNSSTAIYLWGAQLELGSTATTYQPIATTQQAFISNQFKYNLVNPVDSDAAFRLVFNGGWTHSANGATPNGTNGYADTKLNANSILDINSSSISIYSRTEYDDSSLGCDIGAKLGSNDIVQIVTRTSNTLYFDFYVSGGSYAVANTTSLGLFLNTTNSTQTKIFKNENILSTVSNTTKTKPNANITLGSRSGLLFSRRQLAFSSIGDGLTDTEAANFYTAVQAYQTALSRQV